KLRISPIIIGMTIVSLGTSAPEVVVSIIASLEGNGDMVAGNIVGSNIANVTMILGLTVVVSPIVVERGVANRDIVFSIGAALLLLLLVGERWFGTDGGSILTRIDGLIFLAVLVFYMYYIFKKAMRTRTSTLDEEAIETGTTHGKASRGWGILSVILLVGLVGIVLGGDLVVSSATEIAIALGMSQALVGLTIVAIGTSLPELVTSLMAAFKGETEMALGNLVGSGVLNILFVLGIASVISPLEVSGSIIIDIFIMLFVTVAVLIMAKTKYHLNRTEGIILVVFYIVYLAYIIMRG